MSALLSTGTLTDRRRVPERRTEFKDEKHKLWDSIACRECAISYIFFTRFLGTQLLPEKMHDQLDSQRKHTFERAVPTLLCSRVGQVGLRRRRRSILGRPLVQDDEALRVCQQFLFCRLPLIPLDQKCRYIRRNHHTPYR